MWVNVDILDDNDDNSKKKETDLSGAPLLQELFKNANKIFKIQGKKDVEDIVKLGQEAFKFIKKDGKYYIATSAIAAYSILIGRIIEGKERQEKRRTLTLIALEVFAKFLDKAVNDTNSVQMEIINKNGLNFVNSEQFHLAMKNTLTVEIRQAVEKYVENNNLPPEHRDFKDEDYKILEIFTLAYVELAEVAKTCSLEV